jgi:hypothetical protein
LETEAALLIARIFKGMANGSPSSWGEDLIRAPVGIIRGEWDTASTDADAHWLFDALKNSPVRRDVKISHATHLMHLEESRFALYREAETFLKGNDLPNKGPSHKN